MDEISLTFFCGTCHDNKRIYLSSSQNEHVCSVCKTKYNLLNLPSIAYKIQTELIRLINHPAIDDLSIFLRSDFESDNTPIANNCKIFFNESVKKLNRVKNPVAPHRLDMVAVGVFRNSYCFLIHDDFYKYPRTNYNQLEFFHANLPYSFVLSHPFLDAYSKELKFGKLPLFEFADLVHFLKQYSTTYQYLTSTRQMFFYQNFDDYIHE